MKAKIADIIAGFLMLTTIFAAILYFHLTIIQTFTVIPTWADWTVAGLCGLTLLWIGAAYVHLRICYEIQAKKTISEQPRNKLEIPL